MSENKKIDFHTPSADDNEKEGAFEPSPDGMSDSTARLVIDKSLRERLQKEYDILSIENKGQYYAAKVTSKGEQEAYDLLLNKQTGEVQIISQVKRG
ncbi:MAG: hypothetical protein R6U55_11445 [Desulfovermiculus sp.]